MPTRRAFLAASTAAFLGANLPGQSTRLNLAELDRIRILAAAQTAILKPSPKTFLGFTLDLPTYAAACLIDPARSESYNVNAAALLGRAFIGKNTAYPTSFPADADVPATIAARAQLAEVLVALPFLTLPPSFQAAIEPWLLRYQRYLLEDTAALLVRDARDHTASAWLLQVAAIALYLRDESTLSDLRHRFKTVTLRAQIRADGLFPHELTTANPYRNSLFNLDLLAGLCTLLTTRFDLPWDYELQDGPGMRAAIARHAPYIARRTAWPYLADAQYFNQLPGRRPALAFAARAFSQPDYANEFRTLPDLNSATTAPEILTAFPIRQPVLWLTQPKLSPTQNS